MNVWVALLKENDESMFDYVSVCRSQISAARLVEFARATGHELSTSEDVLDGNGSYCADLFSVVLED